MREKGCEIEKREREQRRRERNMSAIVCGKRSSIFEDNISPPVSKRIRCSSSSPVRFSPPTTATTTLSSSSTSFDLIHHLTTIFPHMDHKVIGSVCFDLLFFFYFIMWGWMSNEKYELGIFSLVQICYLFFVF